MSIRFWLRLMGAFSGLLILVSGVVIGAALVSGRVLRSPDLLAFMMTDERAGWDLYAMDVRRQLTVRLTRDDSRERFPAWSPDGTQIAYHADRTGQYEIYVRSLDGRETRWLTQDMPYPAPGYSSGVPQGNAMAAWSPDGNLIAFHSDLSGEWDLYTIRVDGTGLEQLTSSPGDEVLLDWSPDGTKVAYSAGEDGAMRLVVKDLISGTTRTITTLDEALRSAPPGSSMTPGSSGTVPAIPLDLVEDWHPVWSPDGSQLVFTSNRAGSSDVYVVNADGSNLRALTGDYNREYNPIWTRNGEIVYVSDRGGVTEIFRMKPDGSAEERLTYFWRNVDAPAWYSSQPGQG